MESRNRAVIGRIDSLGVSDPDFNSGIGQSCAYGFGETNGERVIAKDDHIFIAGVIYRISPRKDGKIFVGRLNGWNGKFDVSFGQQGYAICQMQSSEQFTYEIAGLHVSEDMKAVVSGTSYNYEPSYYRPFLAGLSKKGLLDHNFGEEGIAFGGKVHGCRELALHPDNIYIAVTEHVPGIASNKTRELLVYNSNTGKLDTFTHTFDEVHNITPNQIDIDSLGRIYVGGPIYIDRCLGYFISRCDVNGKLDDSFCNNGMMTVIYNTFSLRTTKIKIFGDKIYVLGYGITDNSNGIPDKSIIISKHELDGTLDTSFSGDGKRIINYRFLEKVSPSSLTVDDAGNIYICGSANKKIFLTSLDSSGNIRSCFGADQLSVETGVVLYDSFDNPGDCTNLEYRGKDITIDHNGKLVFVGLCIDRF